MKIYITTDMEGVAGIRCLQQTQPDRPEYQEGVRLLTAEVNHVIDAAFSAGATQVVVNDGHHSGRNLRTTDLDPRARLESPMPGLPMPSLDNTFHGILMTGYHAKAGTRNAFLEHTMSSTSWFAYRINGVEIGEVGICAAWASHHGVPVILVTGDQAVCHEAQALLPGVSTVSVKTCRHRNIASCTPLAEAYAALREGVRCAINQRDRCKPFEPTLPANVDLTFQRVDDADNMGAVPGVERIDSRTVRRRIHSVLDVCRW